MCNEIEGSYDKIIITIAPSYTGKNITRLLLRTRNNIDGNKLVIFSGIASYYGDNYILAASTSHVVQPTIHPPFFGIRIWYTVCVQVTQLHGNTSIYHP